MHSSKLVCDAQQPSVKTLKNDKSSSEPCSFIVLLVFLDPASHRLAIKSQHDASAKLDPYGHETLAYGACYTIKFETEQKKNIREQ
jgi:hypothetical protein